MDNKFFNKINKENKKPFLKKQGHPQENDFYGSEKLPHMVDQRVFDIIKEYDLSQHSSLNYYDVYRPEEEISLQKKDEHQHDIDKIEKYLASMSFYSKDGTLRFSDHWWDNEDGNGHQIDFYDNDYNDYNDKNKIPKMTLARYSPEDETWHEILSIPLYQKQPWYKAEKEVHLEEFLKKNIDFLEEHIEKIQTEMKDSIAVYDNSLDVAKEKGYQDLEIFLYNIPLIYGIEATTRVFLKLVSRLKILISKNTIDPVLKEKLESLQKQLEKNLGCSIDSYVEKITKHFKNDLNDYSYKETGYDSYW